MKHVRKGAPFLFPLFALLTAFYFLTPIFSEPSSVSEIDALAPVKIFAEGFKEPTGVVLDQGGSLFVSDLKSGDVLKVNGQIHPVVNNFKRPVGLGFDISGRLLVVEEGAGRLLRLDSNGSLAIVAQGMKKPRWLTLAENGTIYLSAEGLKSQRDREEEDDDEEQGKAILRLSPLGEISILVDGFKRLEGLVVHENTLFAAATGLKEDRDRDKERRRDAHGHENGGSLSDSCFD